MQYCQKFSVIETKISKHWLLANLCWTILAAVTICAQLPQLYFYTNPLLL